MLKRLPINANEFGLIFAVVLVLLLAAWMDTNHTYATHPVDSAIEIARQTSLLGIFALGAAVVIISGGIDLSSGSVIAFSSTVCACILVCITHEAPIGASEALPLWAMVAAVGGTVIVAILIGTLHAWLISSVGLPPFIATLASLVGLRSLARATIDYVTQTQLGLSSGTTQIDIFDENFRYLAKSVWIPVVIFLVLAVLMWLLLSRTVIGRHIYALGGNEDAARLSGIRTENVKWLAYCISSVTASIAGILYFCEESVAAPQTQGLGYELNAIAAAVVGGCSLQGGVGTVLGTCMGTLFLRTVIDSVAKVIKRSADMYEGLIVGVVVVVVVAFGQFRLAVAQGRPLFAGGTRNRGDHHARAAVGGYHDGNGRPPIRPSGWHCGRVGCVGVVDSIEGVGSQETESQVGSRSRETSRARRVQAESPNSHEFGYTNMRQSPPIIAIRQVTKQFPGVLALSDISLDLAEGELHAICGENGAGKSTLMKILSGVLTDYEGELLLRGEGVRFAGTRDAEAAGIAIIHQELNLVEELSAAANIFLGRELRGALGMINDRAMEQQAAALLDELECEISPRALAGSLRVGDQQLIEIAKALSLNTEILIMDEPTSALTEAEVERLYRVIARLRKRGVTILYISHKMDEVFRLADRITVLRDGRLVQTLAREDDAARNHAPDGRPRNRGGRLRRGASQIGAGRARSERPLAPLARARAWVAIEGCQLLAPARRNSWHRRVDGGGADGIARVPVRRQRAAPSGQVLLDGQPVRFAHPDEAMKAGVALVTEDRKRLGLFAQMDVCQNITMCRLGEATAAGLLSRGRERVMADSMVDKLAVKTSGVASPITSLSGGNQQKTIIGRWLLTQPRVLLLDDPTRGVDVGAKAELYRLMDKLCRDGLGIILTSSELPELLTVSDRILVLAEGRLTAEFSREEATEHKIMEAATLS